jgi:choline dehydrogenase-like flavoprotein
MLVDGRTLGENTLMEADVCIVGAGPAGITLARELAGNGVHVCLLESGGEHLEDTAHHLNDGHSVGYWYYPLAETRARGLGGSSLHWEDNLDENGRRYRWYTRPLDAIDFEPKEGIPHTGWPFDRDHLMPFYERAQRISRLGPFEYDAAAWEEVDARPQLPLAPNRVVTNIFQYGSRTFVDFRDELAGSEEVTVILHATACALETGADPDTIASVNVKTSVAHGFRVAARVYVLAAGAIESARLMLLSNQTHAAGIGNSNDLVGRFFMERLSIRSGVIVPNDLAWLEQLRLYEIGFAQGIHVRGALGLNEEVLREEGLLNAAIFLARTHKAFTAEGVRSLVILHRALRRRPVPAQLPRHALNVVRDLDKVALTAYRQSLGRRRTRTDVVAVRLHAEQAPNAHSRVTLDHSSRDALGLPRARLDWRVSDVDRQSIRRTQDILDEELRRAGVGRMERKLGDEHPPALYRGAFHHMGTTRMHPDPTQGVVDVDSRVHGLSNLFVTGSSIFPTAGYANPTLTVVALAVRLADHLKRTIGTG